MSNSRSHVRVQIVNRICLWSHAILVLSYVGVIENDKCLSCVQIYRVSDSTGVCLNAGIQKSSIPESYHMQSHNVYSRVYPTKTHQSTNIGGACLHPLALMMSNQNLLLIVVLWRS